MSDVAIMVDSLGKRYRLGRRGGIYSYKSLRDDIAGALRAPFRAMDYRAGRSRAHRGRPGPRTSPDQRTTLGEAGDAIWALKDVSFEAKRGEVIGIIGRNGAGKTTLLKILSRITEPTEGRAQVSGRVGSLLEVGTGFHPELTGRENIYFNGSVLGMRKAEIVRRFDEIVAFAEVERFIDTPVKHYSSGMYVRLAFAVAAHLDTEVLLVDEVLAVGDVAFQRKCLGKLGNIAHGGRTVLFVSHTMNVVAQLCQEAIVLDHGRLQMKAPAARAIHAYLAETSGGGGEKRWAAGAAAGKTDVFRPLVLRIRNARGDVTDHLASSESFWIEIGYELSEPVRDLRVGILLSGGDGALLFCAFDTDDAARYIERRAAGTYCSRCRIPGELLNEGRFIVGINAGIFNVGRLFQDEHVVTFNVTKTGGAGGHWAEASGGMLRPRLDWEIECT